MSSTWTCEADMLADLQILSTKEVAGAAARDSIALSKKHPTVRMRGTSFECRKKPSHSKEEYYGESTSSSCVTSDSDLLDHDGYGKPSEGASSSKNAENPIYALARELQEFGVADKYSNKSIRLNYEKRYLNKNSQPVIDVSSDSEDEIVELPITEVTSKSPASSPHDVSRVTLANGKSKKKADAPKQGRQFSG